MFDYTISNDFDTVAHAETWLGTPVDKVCISELLPSGDKIKYVPRPAVKRCGAVGIVYKSSIHLEVEILTLQLLNK